jgi:putative endopeptidase
MTNTATYIDRALMDPATPAATDFYRHINGGWLDANPVPAEYPAWGAFLEVHVRNEELLHRLLRDAAAQQPAGGPAAMVGDYVASGLDEALIAAKGLRPLRQLLERIDSIGTVAEIGGLVADLQRLGVGVLFGVDIAPDFHQTDQYLVYVGQGGLGLPERDYYLRDDERSVALRSAYTDHGA